MPPRKARFGNRGSKGGKGKGEGGSRYDYHGYRDDDRGYVSRSDWGVTGEVTDTTTGEAMALPGTVEDVMTAGAREIPGDRHRPTQGTAIVLSRK